jgi:hypothetical protein
MMPIVKMIFTRRPSHGRRTKYPLIGLGTVELDLNQWATQPSRSRGTSAIDPLASAHAMAQSDLSKFATLIWINPTGSPSALATKAKKA